GVCAYAGGTSRSAALVAGATALGREGLQERFGLADPSSALVKAVLLNGADDLAPGQYGVGASREIPPRPNPVEGWGRVNVRQSLGLGGARSMLPVDEPAGLQTQQQRQYPLTVIPGDGPLPVTLAWTAPPSSLLAGPPPANDLAVAGPPSLQLTSSAGGRIEARLPAGSYTLTPAKPGWTFDPPGRTVTLVEGQMLPVEFTASAAPGLLTGLLTGPDGLPIVGAAVAVSPGGLSAITGTDGRYQFAALPPLVYSLTPSL